MQNPFENGPKRSECQEQTMEKPLENGGNQSSASHKTSAGFRSTPSPAMTKHIITFTRNSSIILRTFLEEYTSISTEVVFSNELDMKARDWCLRQGRCALNQIQIMLGWRSCQDRTDSQSDMLRYPFGQSWARGHECVALCCVSLAQGPISMMTSQ